MDSNRISHTLKVANANNVDYWFKNLHSFKRFVRTTVAASHNENGKNQKGDIT